MERIRLEEVESEKDLANIEKDSLQKKIDAMGEEIMPNREIEAGLDYI